MDIARLADIDDDNESGRRCADGRPALGFANKTPGLTRQKGG
jgi:hypothetical protein